MPGARVARGERVTLRIVEEEDVPFLQRGSATPEIRYPLGNPVRSREEFEVSTDGTDRFLVCLDDDADPGRPAEGAVQPIGAVTLTGVDYKRPELGYWLVPAVHREGYGTEALVLAIDYAFREYDTPTVGAEAFDFNDASRGLLESLGFSEEGRKQDFMFVDGSYRDMVMYGLRREDWQHRTER